MGLVDAATWARPAADPGRPLPARLISAALATAVSAGVRPHEVDPMGWKPAQFVSLRPASRPGPAFLWVRATPIAPL